MVLVSPTWSSSPDEDPFNSCVCNATHDFDNILYSIYLNNGPCLQTRTHLTVAFVTQHMFRQRPLFYLLRHGPHLLPKAHLTVAFVTQHIYPA